MYMDDIKIFIKNEKDIEKDIYDKDLQTKCRNKIWYWKMCHAYEETRKRGMTAEIEQCKQERIRSPRKRKQ